ncbi:MAG: cob(I)yrinic acid a,c-diamide adenosyltransferase [Methyloceanibacter sp.]|uniref:cob(I)yrinic acid a,c-diamide adenosyltransferase n=1 Tax=Methyloceanibacter sp. TaxID=1965321 RepID=UPI003EE411DE
MVVLNKIYTRTGDDGTTALGTGERVAKYDLRVEAYGTVDETNAVIGLARLHTGDTDPALDAMLARIQNDLFDLGADLCFPDETKDGSARLSVSDAQVARLESEIDEMNRSLEPLRSFVLPGGRPAASFLHLARTVSRRAERLIVALASRPGEPVSEPAIRYVNRLSDFLFVAARYANDKGATDVTWVPGKNR